MDSLQEQRSVRLRQRLWGAAVLIALLVIFLPLLLDGSGSESQYRRVERLREEPPRIINANGEAEITAGSTPDSSVIRVNSTSGESGQSDQAGQSPLGGQDGQGALSGQGSQGAQDVQDRQAVQGGQGSQGAQDAQNGQGVTQGTQDSQGTQGAQNGQGGIQGTQDGQAIQGAQDGQQALDNQEAQGGQNDRDAQNAQSEPSSEGSETTDTDAALQDRSDDNQSPANEQMRAWVVQAGSFAAEKNALAVRDSLRRAGYPSFVTPTESEPPVFRVRVGPMIDLRQAESKRDEVIDYLGREAIVVSYP